MKQRLAVAVDLGATNIRAALVAPNGKILRKLREETARTGHAGSVVSAQIKRLIHALLEKQGAKNIAGIGISSMGPLNHEKGGPYKAPNVPFRFIPLVKPLEQEFSLSVLLLKDTHAGVLAEKHFGAGKALAHLVYITISTGIGGGAIVDGKLLYGKSRNAAEIGHLVVDTAYNIPCTCKKGTGHWEGLASGRNIPRFFKQWANRKARTYSFHAQSAQDIFKQAKRTRVAREFLEELARINARAISDIIVAYDPELITLGGSVVLNNQRGIVQGIKRYADRYLQLPKIQVTRLGEDISLLGAASFVFQKKMGSS